MHFSAVLFVAVVGLAAGHLDVHHHAQPYAFGYSIKDHHGEQHREESGDGGNGVKGSYGFTDDRGVHRQVHYVADHAGFRAEVKTNEPGTANQNPAAVKMISSAHNGHNLGYAGVGAGLGYAAGSGLGYAGVGAGLGYAAGSGLGYAGVGAGLGYGAGSGLGYAGAGAVYGLGYAGGLGGGYGYNYAAPLHGGYVSVYDSRHAYV